MKDKLIEKQRELIQYIKKFWDIRSIRSLAKLESEISALEKQIEDKSKSADIIQKIEDYAQELMVNRDYYSRAYIIGHLVEKVKSLINK